jgi:DNA-binding beta-propeller fold protein YncE
MQVSTHARIPLSSDLCVCVCVCVCVRVCVLTDVPPSDAAEALAATLTALSSALTTMATAEAAVTEAIEAMQMRVTRAVASTREASEAIVAALTRAQAAVLSRARSRYRMIVSKLLTERSEEADANARLLDAVASIHDVQQLSALFVRDVDLLPLAFMLRGTSGSAVLMCCFDNSVDIAANWAAVFCDVVDASTSEVSGPGTVSFVWCDSARNAIRLVPCLPSGAVAEYVTVDDVAVAVVAGSAVVCVGVSGSFDCVYTVDEGVREVDMRISVCGVLVWAGVVRPFEITGRHLQSYAVATGYKFGLIVSPNGRYMAVSYFDEGTLLVYRLEADGIATLLHTVGTVGNGPMQFDGPAMMCFTPAGNLLVCEYDADRVQELTGLGEAEPQHVRFIPVVGAISIALHDGLLAVGTCSCTIELLSYSSGALIRSISSRGSGPGQIGVQCGGLCFTPDGQFIVAAEHMNERLSMFRVSDGGFEKHIGAGVVSNGMKDVQFAPNGELLVADCSSHRVCVFSADGDTCLRTWGAHGSADGQFEYPAALALVGSKLFVLDMTSSRVQVFE